MLRLAARIVIAIASAAVLLAVGTAVSQAAGKKQPPVVCPPYGPCVRDAVGTVDLIVISPPYACDAGSVDKPAWKAGGRLCPPDSLNYSTDRANVGHARGTDYEAAMAGIYAGCHQLLRPGGLMVTITKNTRRRGRTFDLAGTTVALARTAGFTYLQHVIALHAAVRDSGLAPRPSFWQLTQHRHAVRRGDPAHVVVHEDVCVFAKVVGQPPVSR